MNYYEYIRSPQWEAFKRRYRAFAREECIICRTTRSLELHHITYERLGRESFEDVCWLCRKHHQCVTEGWFTITGVVFYYPTKTQKLKGKLRRFFQWYLG